MECKKSNEYNPTILNNGERFNRDIFNKILEENNGKKSVAYGSSMS